jgi:hypothetical protein
MKLMTIVVEDHAMCVHAKEVLALVYYREYFDFVDQFTALHFMVTGVLLAAWPILILPMNQHA